MSRKASLGFATEAHETLKFKTALDLESACERFGGSRESFKPSRFDTGGHGTVRRSGSHLRSATAVRKDDAVLFASENTRTAL